MFLKGVRAFVGSKFSRLIELWVKNEKTLWPLAILAVAAIGSVVAWQLWEDIEDQNEPISTTIRNVALIVGGLIAILLAMWRSRVAERQADTSQQGLLYDRYQRGAQMLGDGNLAVRLAGIYTLQRLAEEHPDQYHIQIMQLFCSFVRSPTDDGRISRHDKARGETGSRLRADVQAALYAIGGRSQQGIAKERGSNNFSLDLRFANLKGAFLDAFNLSGAILTGSDLSNSSLNDAQLDRAILFRADISYSSLSDANLAWARLSEAKFTEAVMLQTDLSNTYGVETDFSGAHLADSNCWNSRLMWARFAGTHFRNANLSATDFSISDFDPPDRATDHGLTQAQLNEAWCRLGVPPNLHGLLDAETHEPLVWLGRTLEP